MQVWDRTVLKNCGVNGLIWNYFREKRILCEVSPLSVGQTFQNPHLVVQTSCQPGESLSRCWTHRSVRCVLWRQPSWEFQSSAALAQTSKDHPQMPPIPNKQTGFPQNHPGSYPHLHFWSLSQGQPPVYGSVKGFCNPAKGPCHLGRRPVLCLASEPAAFPGNELPFGRGPGLGDLPRQKNVHRISSL